MLKVTKDNKLLKTVQFDNIIEILYVRLKIVIPYIKMLYGVNLSLRHHFKFI